MSEMMSFDFHYKMFLRVSDGKLFVRLGRDESEFDGSVVRTLRHDDDSVGITKDGYPVFIRLRDAGRRHPAIADMASKIGEGALPNPRERQVLLETCFRRMGEILKRAREAGAL